MADLDDEGTVGRREAIKKGAAIAGGVWAVPAIVTMATPAYAVGSSKPPEPCETDCRFVVRLTRNATNNTYGCSTPPVGGELCGVRQPDCSTSSCGRITSAVGDPTTGAVRVCFSCSIVSLVQCQECPECACTGATADPTSSRCWQIPSACSGTALPEVIDVEFVCGC